MIRFLFIISSILIFSYTSSADTRYWISAAGSNWNNTANWSTSSGGAGGASVPGSSDYAIFDANGTGVCTLDMDATVVRMKMEAGTLNTSTYNYTVSGSSGCTFSGGTINGNNTFTISLTGTANLTFSGTTFNPDIHASSPRLHLNGSTFNNTSYFEKTGATNNNSTGGNTFVGNCTIKNTGSANFNLGSNGNDSFSADLSIDNSSVSNIYIAYNNSTTTIGGNLIVNNNGSGNIGFSYNGTSSLSISGNCTINTNTSGENILYLGQYGTVSISGTLDITNGGIDTSTVYIANKASSSVTIGGATTILNNGTGYGKTIYIGNNGDVTFNNTLKITNSSPATKSFIACNYNDDSDNNYNDNIILELNNASSTGISFGNSGGEGIIATGKTITIGALGFSSGILDIKNIIQTGTTSQSITTTGTSKFNIKNCEWNGNIDFKAPQISTKETTYKGTASIEKTGTTNNNLGDENVYKENATITNSSASRLTICDANPDTYEKNLTINNSGTNEIFFGDVASGIQILGDFIVNNTNNATNIRITNNELSNVTISGTTTITNNSAAASALVYLGYNGDITANDDCSITNEATGAKGNTYIAQNENSSVNITGDISLINKNADTEKRIYFGNNGDITLNGNLSINNTATATNSHIYLNRTATSNNQYNGNITLASNGAGCDGIYFGNNGGTATLSNGSTISIDAINGFSEGRLTIKYLTQTGTTAQSLELTSNSKFYLYNSTWGANISLIAPSIYLNSSTFNGTATIEKNGSSTSTSYGGNTYNKAATIENSGSNWFKLANSVGNDYNDNVTFIRSGTAYIRPAYNFTSTLSKDLYINTNAAFHIGNGVGGWFVFDGTSAQSINNSGAANTIEIRRLRTNNTTNEITLNTPVRVKYNLDLSNGNIITTNSNILRMNDDAVVDNVSDNAYIDGPIVKYGDDAFVFPTGGTDSYGSSHYAGIGISAPSATTHSFTAQYYAAGHASATTYSAPLTKVSLVEYWTLDRTVGASTVDVGLYWNNGTRSGIGDLADLRVAHWDGSTWEDKGNDATSGNTSSGSISVTAVSNFSPFTLGTIDNVSNPLPVSLIKYNAFKENEFVKLEWTTASEENNDYFIIERSTNFKDIEELQTVDGNGNSNKILNYEAFDYYPLIGKSYYRLVQVDFDGKREYFDWKVVDFLNELDNSISIYPNPSDKGITNIITTGFEGNTIIEVMDLNTRVIFSQDVTIEVNNHIMPLNLNLSSGVYFIRLTDGQHVDIKKWIVR